MQIKRWLPIVAIVTVISAAAAVATAQRAGTCSAIDAQPNPIVRAGVPGEAVSDGDVGCFVIHDGDDFITSGAAIGDIGVIRRGVKAAVEISGVTGDGSVVNFGREIQVCLRGTGEFIFRSAATTPRISAGLPAVTRELESGTYTCALIGTTGTAILVEGEPAPAAGDVTLSSGGTSADPEATGTEEAVSASAPVVSASGEVSLSGCRVTTTAMVRLREEATTDSGIITRLPYRLSLQATSRTADSEWYQVIYGNGQGWVSGDYLRESAGCSE